VLKRLLAQEGISIRYQTLRNLLSAIERDVVDMEGQLRAPWLLTLKKDRNCHLRAWSFSTSRTAYVSRFAKEHSLLAPHRDVRACLEAKARICLAEPAPVTEGSVRQGSALQMRRLFPTLAGKVDVILTSPPYLNRQTYSKDNWLRLWFLGADRKSVRKQSLETASTERYSAWMQKFFAQASGMLATGGQLVCVAGDVRSQRTGRSIVRTGDLLLDAMREVAPHMDVLSYSSHTVPNTSRYFHALIKSNGHKAVPLRERVLVARKVR